MNNVCIYIIDVKRLSYIYVLCIVFWALILKLGIQKSTRLAPYIKGFIVLSILCLSFEVLSNTDLTHFQKYTNELFL